MLFFLLEFNLYLVTENTEAQCIIPVTWSIYKTDSDVLKRKMGA